MLRLLIALPCHCQHQVSNSTCVIPLLFPALIQLPSKGIRTHSPKEETPLLHQSSLSPTMTSTDPPSNKRDQGIVTRTLVRGTVPPNHLKSVVYLIKSLCPEVGHLGEFRDYDRVYNASPDVKAPKNSVRLRQHIISPGVPQSTAKEWPVYSLMYLGLPDRRVAAPCEKRSITTIALGKEAEKLLNVLGCVFAFEYVRKGVRYRTRNGFVIEVYVVEKLREKHDLQSCDSLVGDDRHGVVEISSEDGATPEQLAAFMQHLQPLVMLRSPPKKR